MTGMRRVALVVIAAALVGAALAYLREPSWLADGLRVPRLADRGRRDTLPVDGRPRVVLRAGDGGGSLDSGPDDVRRRAIRPCSSRSRSTTGRPTRSCCETDAGTGERSACRRQAGAGCGESTCGSIAFEKAIAACRSANGKFDDGRRDTEFMTKTMKAIHFDTPGGPDVLRPVDRPAPTPAPARSSSASRPPASTGPTSCSAAAATRRRPAHRTSSASRVAGTVVEVGSDETRWRPGDTVCALVAGGGYAEYCAAPSAQCLPIPCGLRRRGGRGDPGNLFHGVDQPLPAWRSSRAARRVLIHGGIERHRHDRHPARARVRRRRSSRRRDPTTSAPPANGSAHTAINYRTADFVEASARSPPARRQRRPRHRRRRLPAAEHRLPGEVRHGSSRSACSAAPGRRSTWRP